MTNTLGLCISTTLLAAAGLGACVSTPTYQTARITNPTEATIGNVKAALRSALGRPQLELGAADYRTATTVTVLPPPLSPVETRSIAVPTVYNIMSDGTRCQLVNSATSEVVALTGVSCTQIAAR